MDLQMTWNTEDLFPTPEAWDKAMEQLKGLIDELAAPEGALCRLGCGAFKVGEAL